MIDIIIPTYNEKENIRPLFTLIHNTFKDLNLLYHIIIVDDNSPDGTYDEVKRYKQNINVTLIKRKAKLGLGTAYKEAVPYCKYNFVIILDADLSHDPSYIKDLINKMEIQDDGKSKYDIITTTRYMYNERSGVVGWNFKRKMTSRGANNLAQVLFGIEISDVTGSFRIYRRDVFDSLTRCVKSNGYAYQMEILYLAVRNKLRISEIPIVFYERRKGCSKMGLWEVFSFMRVLVRLFIFD